MKLRRNGINLSTIHFIISMTTGIFTLYQFTAGILTKPYVNIGVTVGIKFSSNKIVIGLCHTEQRFIGDHEMFLSVRGKYISVYYL